MTRGYVGALLSALILLTNAGCTEERSCTRIGCAASRLMLDTEGWAVGQYEIEVRYTLSGDIAFECTFDVGEQATDAGPIQSTCRQTAGDTRTVELYPPSGMEPTLDVYDSPDEVRLILRSAGETLFDDTIALEHETSYPNGRDCAACRSANMTLSLL
jgi:hypothetical protein